MVQYKCVASPILLRPSIDGNNLTIEGARYRLGVVSHSSPRDRFTLSQELLFVTSTVEGYNGAPLLFASVTGAVSSGIRNASLRRTFNAIDHDSKGHITEQDLTFYAQANGLPAAYVKGFVSAVLQRSGEQAPPQQQQQQQQQQQRRRQQRQQRHGAPCGAAATHVSSASSADPSTPVTFAAFQSFVSSRESALRQAFDLFDRDKDGRISIDDLDSSLAHVAVCCPQTRCVYRCRQQLVHDLVRTVDLQGTKTLAFSQFRQFFMLLPQREMVVEYWLSAAEAAGACCEVDNRILLHTSASRGAPWGHLVAGAAAGAASRTVTAPLETLRLAAMAGTLQAPTLLAAAQQMAAEGGWACLFRGNLVNVLRSAPQKALDFFAFDLIKRKLGDDSPTNTLVAAGLAGSASWLVLYPLEVLRSRITVNPCCSVRRPPLVLLRSIVAAEGWRALYRGLGPSLAAIFPEAAITYGLHDLLKQGYRRLNQGQEPGVLPSLTFGVLAAFTGQTVAYPLETISRRLQVQAVDSSSSAAAVLQELLRQGGPRALYRGIGAATIRLVPMALTSFGTYEVVRSLLLRLEQVQQQQQELAALQQQACQEQEQGQGQQGVKQRQQQQQGRQEQGQEQEVQQWCVVRSLEAGAVPLEGS